VSIDAFNMADAGLGGGRTNGMVEKMHTIINRSNQRKKTTDLDAMVLDMTIPKYGRCAH